MDFHQMYKEAESFVKKLFDKKQHKNLLFHNLKHTENVVEKAKEIASQYELSEEHQFVLYSTAWFHDTGHLFVDPVMHEIKSAELMKEFMTQITNDEQIIKAIEECILATRPPRNPKTLLQEIICDADTYHLGTKNFKNSNKLIKKEYILRGITPANNNWDQAALEFLESHQFYTPYCQQLLNEGKMENIEKLRKKLAKEKHVIEAEAQSPKEQLSTEKTKELSMSTNTESFKESSMPTLASDSSQNNKQANRLLTKGIQTMLRLTSDNHLQLSEMADGKANILISVNAIIISVILTVLLRRLEIDTHLTIPTVIFLTFSLGTIVVAIMATRPKITQGRFSKEDILNKRTNLLFFGNFHKATLEEYEWGMREMMKDPDYLYGALIKDIHHLGVVLGRKYKLIRLAYTVFMVGIIISVLAFTIAVLIKFSMDSGSSNSSVSPL